MYIVLDRGLCDASLSYCQRCSAALIRHPEGEDRPCIREIRDDGEELLTVEMYTDGRKLVLTLSEQERELGGVEGWEALAHFDPALFRVGAMERWHELSRMPVVH